MLQAETRLPVDKQLHQDTKHTPTSIASMFSHCCSKVAFRILASAFFSIGEMEAACWFEGQQDLALGFLQEASQSYACRRTYVGLT